MLQETREILAVLAENAARKSADGQSLPPAIYHSEEIFKLEIEKLFLRGWICIGRAAEIPRPGDFAAFDIIDQAIFIVRQKDLAVKAFPNVCLHRCARLLSGRGHVSKVSCPYHSWTYDLDGSLVGAPFMQKTPEFKTADFVLASLPCEVWQGFIYVNLDRNAAPIGDALATLGGEIADFHMEDYVPVYEEEEVWNTNWKCLVENFMDVYHLHRVHAESFNKYGSFEDVSKFFPGEDAYAFHYVQEDGGPNSVAAHPENTWLQGDMRHRTYLMNIFPSHVVQLQPDLLWYLSILPDGIDKVRIRWAVSIPGEFLDNAADRNGHIAEELALLKQVNSEDRPTVESVYRATRSRDATQGPLSWLERNVWDFGRYLARNLKADS